MDEIEEIDRRIKAMREARDEADLEGDAETYVAAAEAIDELLDLRLVTERQEREHVRVPPRAQAV